MARDSKIKEVSLLEIVESYSRSYGAFVVEQRAVADYRDGFKPVQRRITWGLSEQGLRAGGRYRKSARVVGDVMGKFHPHGDQSIYGAMQTMVNSPSPIIDGEGNWGSWSDPAAAAMRYTEARMTEYADKHLVNKDYLPLAKLVRNYDGSEQEPVVLPALLPNLLLNGTVGIAYGVSTNIPPFKLKGLLKLIRKSLSGAEITPKDCVKYLEFNYTDGGGGEVVSPDEELLEYYKTGEGRVKFRATREIDRKARTYTITGLPPYFNWNEEPKSKTGANGKDRKPKSIYGKLSDHEDVYQVLELSDEKNPVKIVVEVKKSIPETELKEVWADLDRMLTVSVSMFTNITIRHSDEDVDFAYMTIPQIIEKWVRWRVRLEKKGLKYWISEIDKKIRQQDLLLRANENFEALAKIIRDKNLKKIEDMIKKIMKLLDCTDEEATTVLGYSLRRLSRLEASGIRSRKDELLKERKLFSKDQDDPGARVLRWVEDIKT